MLPSVRTRTFRALRLIVWGSYPAATEYCCGDNLAVDWDEEALRARRDPRHCAASSAISSHTGARDCWCSSCLRPGPPSAWCPRSSPGIMFDLRNQLFDRLVDQSVGFFTESRTAGDPAAARGDDRPLVPDGHGDAVVRQPGAALALRQLPGAP